MDNARMVLSSYSQNILKELKGHAGGFLKVREPDLIRLSQVPSARILEARDELDKCLAELERHNIVTYEKQGDRYTIRNIMEKE